MNWLKELEPFMFRDFTKDKMATQSKIQNLKEKPITFEDVTYPKRKDNLFWCYYILKYGINDYNNLDTHPFKIERKIKEKSIELLNKNKSKIKERRIKYDVNDLLCEPSISLNMFFALCCASSINVTLVDQKTYFTLIDNLSNKNNFIFKNKYQYGIMNKKPDDLNKTHLKAVNLNKIIKGISAYKLNEIEEMCDILKINLYGTNSKRLTKKDLYDKIQMCIKQN